MRPVRLSSAILAASLAGLLLSACGKSTVPPEPSVSINPAKRTLALGEETDLLVVAYDAEGGAGKGDVTITVPNGQLERKAQKSVTLPLANGRTGARYSCALADSDKCLGTQEVTVSWNGLKSTTKLTVGTPSSDAGGTGPADAGTAANDAATAAGEDAATAGKDASVPAGADAAVAGADAAVAGEDAAAPGPDAATPTADTGPAPAAPIHVVGYACATRGGVIAPLTGPVGKAIGLLPDDPGEPGTNGWSVPNGAKRHPDGRLLYIQKGSDTLTLRVFTPDTPTWDGPNATWTFGDPLANDDVVPTSACDSKGGPGRVWVGPEDLDIYFDCATEPGTFHCVDGQASRIPNGTLLTISGTHALYVPVGTNVPLHTVSPVGSPAAAVDTQVASGPMIAGKEVYAQARKDGFWVAYENQAGGVDLWTLDVGLPAEEQGAYQLPSGVTLTRPLVRAIDQDGAAYAIAGTVVYKLTTTDPAVAVYTPDPKPADCSTAPPTTPYIPKTIVTGP